MSVKIKEAMEVVGNEIKNDEGYMIGWYSNLAMLAQDAGGCYTKSQHQAAQFIKNTFGVDVSAHRDKCIARFNEENECDG